MTDHGKWSVADVPHKGWSCVAVTDNGPEDEGGWTTCEMCESIDIRYVHHMTHPDYEELGVGCVCAENMEEDYVGPRLRELTLRSRAMRQRTWGRRRWFWSYPNNQRWYLNVEGFHIRVFSDWGDGRQWMIEVTRRSNQRSQRGVKRYPSKEAAMAKALDALLWAKDHLR